MKREGLTSSELRLLREDSQPSILAFIDREGPQLATRTNAYRKVAAAARARREALLEVRALELAEGIVGIGPTIEDVQALEDENARLRQQIEALIAAPALAVHSGD